MFGDDISALSLQVNVPKVPTCHRPFHTHTSGCGIAVYRPPLGAHRQSFPPHTRLRVPGTLLDFLLRWCLPHQRQYRTRGGRDRRLMENFSQRSRGRGDKAGGKSDLLLALLDLKGATVRFENAVRSVYLCIKLRICPCCMDFFPYVYPGSCLQLLILLPHVAIKCCFVSGLGFR
jgi:hypothetical protein